jgi:hypothetical protein
VNSLPDTLQLCSAASLLDFWAALSHGSSRTSGAANLEIPRSSTSGAGNNSLPHERRNAHVKDKLEDRLHALVCAGKLPTEQAQHGIAVDWVVAYERYLGKPENTNGEATNRSYT